MKKIMQKLVGKQKSFVIVLFSFIVIIALVLLIPVFVSGSKKTIVKFQTAEYLVEVGKTRALAPDIYAGGKVKNADFTYSVENESIADVLMGSYSYGSNQIKVWVFTEIRKNSRNEDEVIEQTGLPYFEGDVVTVKDNYWYINDVKTTCTALRNYSEEEINEIAVPVDGISYNCFIFNGNLSKIPYDETKTPIRNEETGTWFIDGKDTGFTYKGVQCTIITKACGKTTLTMNGKIEGKEYTAKTTINVLSPDPASMVSTLTGDTMQTHTIDGKVYNFIKINEEIKENHTISSKTELYSPLQDVTYSFSAKDILSEFDSEGSTKGLKAGKCTITVRVPKSSFKLGADTTIKETHNVIVIDGDNELINKIVEACGLISVANNFNKELKVKTNLEFKTAVDNARAAVNVLGQVNEFAITNLSTLEKLEKIFEN